MQQSAAAASWRRGGTTPRSAGAAALATAGNAPLAADERADEHASLQHQQHRAQWHAEAAAGTAGPRWNVAGPPFSSPSAASPHHASTGRLPSAAYSSAAASPNLPSGVPSWLPANPPAPHLPAAAADSHATGHGHAGDFEDVLTLQVPQGFLPFGAAGSTGSTGFAGPAAAASHEPGDKGAGLALLRARLAPRAPFHGARPASSAGRRTAAPGARVPRIPPGAPPAAPARRRQAEPAGASPRAGMSGMTDPVPPAEPGSAAPHIKVDVDEENRSDARTRNANGEKTTILRDRQLDAFSDQQSTLPAEKGFPIQIGSELFRLSGASIMSDAPSYFSRFFEEQLRQAETDGSGGVKTLYIDRDPITFQDIALHLQGYFVKPRDATHYVKLFADAQFYGLPRLIKQLFESDICIRIGEREFQVSRDLFSASGNTPNYFTLGFAMFAPTSGELFPGLDRENLFRPPSIDPPSLLNRSSSTFQEILHLLRGYPVAISSPEHRAALLRDCRYYHFKGLEQSLVPHAISHNAMRGRYEMLMRLEDIRQSGVSFSPDPSPADRSPLCGWVNYARPYVDDHARELVLEVGDEGTRIDLRAGRAEFFGTAKARITSLFQVVATKMNLPSTAPLGLMLQAGGVSGAPVSPGNTPLSDDLVKVRVEPDAHVLLDGEDYDGPAVGHAVGDGASTGSAAGPGSGGGVGSGSVADSRSSAAPSDVPMGGGASDISASARPRKRRRRGSLDDFGEWIVRRGQWRLRVQPRPEQDDPAGQMRMEIVMLAVKLDAVSGQRGRNALRGWLNE